MKFRIKLLTLAASRPVAFLHINDAKKLDVHTGDRVDILKNSQKIVAVVDIGKKIMSQGEIAVSEEVIKESKLKQGDLVDVALTLPPASVKYILKKVNGQSLTKSEIEYIIKDIVTNTLNEAEIAYFVFGVYKNGMTLNETIYLTNAMYKVGTSLHWPPNKKIADKHSIGGIPGNRTTPIVVSICTSAGIVMPKTSSRAITTAAGTADVMECITKVDLSVAELKKVVHKTEGCFAWGGSLGLAPADDKLIRVERLLKVDPESQLIASILAKKLSVGSRYILIDIPYGESAKVSKSKGKELKKKFIQVGSHFGLKIRVLLTDGSQPMGNGVGPVLEMKDVLSVLKRDNPPKDLEDKSLLLAGEILEMVGKAVKGKGILLAREILESGKAYKKFEEIVNAQGRVAKKWKEAKFKYDVISKKDAKIKKINNKDINSLGRDLGCPVDKTAGIYIYKHKNDLIKKGEKLMTLYAESKIKLKEALAFLHSTNPFTIG